MLSGKLIGTLVALSIACSASAQTPAPKPKPATKKPAAATKAAPKAAPAPVAAPAPPPPATDVKVHTKYVNGAQISENTTYMKGMRQRFEFPGITMVSQCDLKRTLQIHDATKHYMVVSTEPPAAQPAAPAAAPDMSMAQMMAGGGGAPQQKQQGGVITETITLTDTGERKQLFGLEARHIKSVNVRQPGPNACDAKTTTVETDGWYADLPEHASCPAAAAQAPPPPAPAGQQTCTDRVVTQQVGDAKLGFALGTVITTTIVDSKDKDGKDKDVSTMTMDVTDLQVTSLDKALFDVPSGYTEVTNYQALLPSLANGGSLAEAVFGSITDGTSAVAPRKPGIIRVGIVDPTSKIDKPMPELMLRGSLLGAFTKAPFEAVPVSGASHDELDKDATQKECDYILVSDVAELKTSKPNKIGGMLKKVSGDANTSNEIHEARIDYKLFAVNDWAKPRMTSSVKTSSGGGFGVGSALRLAAFAGSMYLTMGMGSGAMMGMLGQGSSFGGLGGLGGGLMGSRVNPGMGAAMSIMSTGAAMGMPGGMPAGMPGMGDPSGQKAVETVQDGLSKAGKQVAEELKKGKPVSAEKK